MYWLEMFMKNTWNWGIVLFTLFQFIWHTFLFLWNFSQFLLTSCILSFLINYSCCWFFFCKNKLILLFSLGPIVFFLRLSCLLLLTKKAINIIYNFKKTNFFIHNLQFLSIITTTIYKHSLCFLFQTYNWIHGIFFFFCEWFTILSSMEVPCLSKF